MDIKEYISSGILELYVLGQLSPEEMAQVEDMQSKYVEVQKEIYDISISLEQYGRLTAIKAPTELGDKILSQLPPKQHSNSTSKDLPSNNINWKMMTLIFGLTSIFGIGMYMWQTENHEQELKNMKNSLIVCDSIRQAATNQYAMLNDLNDSQNKIIGLTPTKDFNGIMVYLHHNENTKKNYLQLNQLPEINEDQAFQLWSLKPGMDPIPLDVFTDQNKIIEISYVDETPTYAITIEPKGGSKSPSLDKLIGTMSVI